MNHVDGHHFEQTPLPYEARSRCRLDAMVSLPGSTIEPDHLTFGRAKRAMLSADVRL